MDLLSNSQLKLLAEFQNRVKQSERRLQEMSDGRTSTQGQRTPDMLPYVGTSEDMSKFSVTHSVTEPIQVTDQGMITGEMNTPPQKQLKATVFNETPSYNTRSENPGTEHSDKPNKVSYNRLQISPKNSIEKYEPKGSSTKAEASFAKYEPKDSSISKFRHSHHETSPEQDKVSESFQRGTGYTQSPIQIKKTYGGIIKEPVYASKIGNDIQDEMAQNYDRKLDEYLRSQELRDSEINSLQTRSKEDENYYYAYRLSDENRRLKVPSIRLFEEGQIPMSLSSKTTPYGYRFSEKQTPSEPKSGLTSFVNRDVMKEQSRTYFYPEKDEAPLAKKVPAYPKKANSTQEAQARDDGIKTSSAKKNEAVVVSNTTTSRPMRSIINDEKKRPHSFSSRRRKSGNAKKRPSSKEIKEISKTNQSSSFAPMLPIGKYNEEDKKAVAKDILRKFRLGKIDQNQLAKALEDEMKASEQFYETLKGLLKKH